MILHQLELLVAAYKKEAEDADETDEHDESVEVVENEETEEPDGELDDDEDDKNKRNPLLQKAKLGQDTDDEEDDDPMSLAQTMLEIDYQTYIDDEDVVDEYCLFKDIFQTIQTTDQEWFARITSGLTEEMTLKLQATFVTAEQRRAAMEARKRESEGGYSFTITSIPQAFTFTSPHS